MIWSLTTNVEVEKDGKPAFLDVLVTRNRLTHSLHTSVYRKPTHTDCCLHYRSYHSPPIKNGIIKTLLHRSTTICRDRDSQKWEVAHIFSMFLRNGYPLTSFAGCFKTTYTHEICIHMILLSSYS